jgi:hypothetical protein
MTYGVLLHVVMDWLCWLVGSALIVCCTAGGSQPCLAWCTEASTMDRFLVCVWFCIVVSYAIALV